MIDRNSFEQKDMKFIRNKFRLTQREVSNLLHCNLRSLQKLEAGDSELRGATRELFMERMVDKLKVWVDVV